MNETLIRYVIVVSGMCCGVAGAWAAFGEGGSARGVRAGMASLIHTYTYIYDTYIHIYTYISYSKQTDTGMRSYTQQTTQRESTLESCTHSTHLVPLPRGRGVDGVCVCVPRSVRVRVCLALVPLASLSVGLSVCVFVCLTLLAAILVTVYAHVS